MHQRLILLAIPFGDGKTGQATIIGEYFTDTVLDMLWEDNPDVTLEDVIQQTTDILADETGDYLRQHLSYTIQEQRS